MATALDYNHIHPGHEKSYGHMAKKGGDKHLTANHDRGSAPGLNQGGGQSGQHVGPAGLE
jgi:hypothetical protein